MTKYLIFDTGSLINITQNGLIETFKELETIFQGEFLITPEVKYEAIEHPLNIRRFEWGALRIQHLLDDEIIRPFEDVEEVTQEELKKRTNDIMERANNCFFADSKPIHLIERGEAECLALCSLLNEKNIDNMLVVDERTARMLCENPEALRELMENKVHKKLISKLDNLKYLKNIKVMRSTELVYMAFKKGALEGDNKSLEAALYALKYGGCSISEKEVQLMKKL